jgi:hypothetical protein
MINIDQELKQMLEDCPILLDEDFGKQHPGIVNVAGFLNASAKTHYRAAKRFDPFDRVGVDNIREYITLIHAGNADAVRTYQNLRDTLGF